MWKAEEKTDIPNLDNHLAAIATAQSTLADIKEEISHALGQRDSLLSGNHEILKSKTDELNAKIKEFDDLRTKASEANAQNIDKQEILKNELARHERGVIAHNAERLDFMQGAENKLKELNEYEAKINEQAEANKQKQIELETLSQELAKNRDVHAKKSSELEKTSQEIEANKIEHRELIATAEARLDEIKATKEEILKLRQTHADELIAFSKSKQEQDVSINQVKADLEAAVKDRENAQNLVIEAKRIGIENAKKLDSMRKGSVIMSEQIAELSKLKDELSKKEPV